MCRDAFRINFLWLSLKSILEMAMIRVAMTDGSLTWAGSRYGSSREGYATLFR